MIGKKNNRKKVKLNSKELTKIKIKHQDNQVKQVNQVNQVLGQKQGQQDPQAQTQDQEHQVNQANQVQDMEHQVNQG